MSIETFYIDFMQTIYSEAEAGSKFNEPVFVEKVCDYLVEQAVIENYSLCSYKKESLGLKIDAWYQNEENGVLTLIVSNYKDEFDTLTTTTAAQISKRAIRFFKNSLNSSFYQTMEETDQAYSIAREICLRKSVITSVKIITITNSVISKSLKAQANIEIESIPISFDIWDIERIYHIDSSKSGKEPIVIDFAEQFGGALPCLPAFSNTDEFQSYLLVLPASLLATLYEKYNERLLEQNVRTFLQFKGKVNKKMRVTILNEPNMFFAFNNGLTATAEEIITTEENGRLSIKSLRNPQIVNGGQTTASIYNTLKKDKADLSQVFIQVKLTIVPPEHVEFVVPKISEYANTQNKVNAADFFSNNPFHWRFEELSRRLWAPSVVGGLKETHWFYERARGQYMTAKNQSTVSEQKLFEARNPKNQMVTKTDLAKYYNSWEKIPHKVSLGAQKNFAIFAEVMTSLWEKDDKYFNELFFRESIAKAILFKDLDKQIMKQSWYGGYKANIVTYTLSKFRAILDEQDVELDLEKIWKQQKLSVSVLESLLCIAKVVNESIQATPPHVTNIGEWCKKIDCWQSVLLANVMDLPNIKSELIDKNKVQQRHKDAAEVQKIDNGIEAQKYVINKGAEHWGRIVLWNEQTYVLTPKEKSILAIASQIPLKIPSEKQCLSIFNVESKVKDEGFI
jgi:hypothetical protein